MADVLMSGSPQVISSSDLFPRKVHQGFQSPRRLPLFFLHYFSSYVSNFKRQGFEPSRHLPLLLFSPKSSMHT